MKSFIEVQFPVSKLSKESYKERMANYSQTLTGLGKWWGRKPLIIVRSLILGLLMPASNDSKKDREIFLKILTMDEEGLWKRKAKSIPQWVIYEHLTPHEKQIWFTQSIDEKPKLKKGIKKPAKQELQRIVFMRLTYDEKLDYCIRPEQIEGPSSSSWAKINDHFMTTANNLPDLIRKLGERQFGHVPRVGDSFCGGGSIPFEAARIGCNVYGSDLSPVAALLTWAALKIIGSDSEIIENIRLVQNKIYNEVESQIEKWEIEKNEFGWRAEAYLYCHETRCPDCGWKVPLAPSWVIGEKTWTIAKLIRDMINQRFDIEIKSDVAEKEIQFAKSVGTVKNAALVCPNPGCGKSTPIAMIRGDRRSEGGKVYGLRLWENDDLTPRIDDVFQERLYCIRWTEKYLDQTGNNQIHRYYRAPNEKDLQREQRVLFLLRERFHDWQEKGFLPVSCIEHGYNTDQLIRERGWTRWHHLFNPRQLLINGLILREIEVVY